MDRDYLYEQMLNVEKRLIDMWERMQSDDLDIADGAHNELYEYPLEIIDERGREFAVVLGSGGPHIEIVADGLCAARLEGYSASDKVTLSGEIYDNILDYFIER